MVVDDTIVQALNRIADNQEELNETLKLILGHYNSVVPVMKRNSDRVEKAHEEAEESPSWFDHMIKSSGQKN